MGERSYHVFVSGVSADFRAERVALERWLERKDLHVSSQEKLNPGGSTLWNKLRDEIGRCRAAICLIGTSYGYEPETAAVPPGAPSRSYTQWEFWLARGEGSWPPLRREKVYVFFPANLKTRFAAATAAAKIKKDKTALAHLSAQEAYVAAVKKTGIHYDTFTDEHDLIAKCLRKRRPNWPVSP